MTFATAIAALPYNARGTNAAGFLPPIVRAQGHILFALAASSDDTLPVTNEDVIEELVHAQIHWGAITTPEAVSRATAAHIDNFGEALTFAVNDYQGWTEAQKVTNLRDLANRLAGLSAVLDRELVGITDSDPGYQL
jgi:hypothetical protein